MSRRPLGVIATKARGAEGLGRSRPRRRLAHPYGCTRSPAQPCAAPAFPWPPPGRPAVAPPPDSRHTGRSGTQGQAHGVGVGHLEPRERKHAALSGASTRHMHPALAALLHRSARPCAPSPARPTLRPLHRRPPSPLTMRSNRPGRLSAGSSDSGRLVAAMTMMPSEDCGGGGDKKGMREEWAMAMVKPPYDDACPRATERSELRGRGTWLRQKA
jgi:hypothetical protein